MLKILLRQRWMLVGLLCFLALFSVLVYDANRELTSTHYIKGNLPAAELKQLEAINTTPHDSENGFLLLLEAANKIQYPGVTTYIFIPGRFEEPLPLELQEWLRKYLEMNTESLSLVYQALEYPHIQLPPLRPYDQNDDNVYDKIGEIYRFLSYWMIDAAIRNDRVLLDEAITINRQFLQQLSYRNYLQDEMVRQSLLTGNVYRMEALLSYALPSPATIREHLTLFSVNDKEPLESARIALINETMNLSSSHELTTEFSEFFRDQSDVMRLLGMETMEWSQLPFIAAKLFTKSLTHTLAVGREDIYTAATFYRKEEYKKARYALHGIFYPPEIGSAYIYAFFAKNIAGLNVARCALASLLFYYDHDRMPDTLEELVPDYLDTLPRDPFTPDQPIRFRMDGDIALFYSIGENEINDHGLSRSHNSQTKNMDNPNCDDIVFRLKVPQGGIPLDPSSGGDL